MSLHPYAHRHALELFYFHRFLAYKSGLFWYSVHLWEGNLILGLANRTWLPFAQGLGAAEPVG